MTAVVATDLARSFTTHKGVLRRTREDVQAVRGVSFTIEPGELFGLLGPNGAVGRPVLEELGIGLGYAAAGLGTLAWMERSSRRHATLDRV